MLVAVAAFAIILLDVQQYVVSLDDQDEALSSPSAPKHTLTKSLSRFGKDAMGITSATAPAKGRAMNAELPALRTALNVYYVSSNGIDENGLKNDCGDATVPVRRYFNYSKASLKEVITFLLTDKGADLASLGLKNMLGPSTLSLKDISFEGGLAIIHLDGKLNAKNYCQAFEAFEQIRRTAMQFFTVLHVEILVNNTPTETILKGLQ
jgi:hypothetical protein